MNRRLRTSLICIIIAIVSTAVFAAPSPHEVALLWPEPSVAANAPRLSDIVAELELASRDQLAELVQRLSRIEDRLG